MDPKRHSWKSPGRVIAGLLYQGFMQRERGKLGTQTTQALKSGKPGFKHQGCRSQLCALDMETSLAAQ